MKSLVTTVLLCSLFFHVVAAQDSGRISPEERSLLLNYLELGKVHLIHTISSIDDQQWEYKPEESSWSVAQCMSHILTAEKGLFQNIQELLQQAAENKPELKKNDAWLIGKINDRGNKVKTPLEEAPEIMSREEAIESLKASRSEIAAFLKQKKLPLRHHIGRSPYGPADTYQLFLVIAAHSMRHHAQMEEVLAGMTE